MKTCYWNRALAWKEWRQNNSKIWVLGVFMSGTPIIGTVFFLYIPGYRHTFQL
jgi:hypothetical protein